MGECPVHSVTLTVGPKKQSPHKNYFILQEKETKEYWFVSCEIPSCSEIEIRIHYLKQLF